MPLAPHALALFREALQAAEDGDYVFSARSGSKRYPHLCPVAVSKRRLAILRSLGMHDLTTHDLRRTMASQARALGIAHDVRRELLNHKPASGNITDGVYNAHDYDHEKRDALMRWEQHLLQVVG